jgi:large subunit ribosomal protein L10
MRPFIRVVKIKGGVLGTKAIDADGVTALAALPSRAVLQARLAGAIISPVATMAGLLSAPLRNLVYGLQQLAERKAAAGGA